MSWWWCLEHKRVEESLGCGSTTRLGPYDSAQLAAGALERVRSREAEQQARDPSDDDKRGKK